MKNVNKTAQILKTIARKRIISLSDLCDSKPLVELFENSKTTTPKRRIIDSCTLLAKQGFISVGNVDDDKVFKITVKGQEHLKKAELLQFDIQPLSWNGRWYLVTINLPESKKTIRNQILLVLKRFGFIQYSKGIWIYPYNPSDLITKMRDQYNLKNEIKLIVASYIDDHKRYQKIFKINT